MAPSLDAPGDDLLEAELFVVRRLQESRSDAARHRDADLRRQGVGRAGDPELDVGHPDGHVRRRERRAARAAESRRASRHGGAAGRRGAAVRQRRGAARRGGRASGAGGDGRWRHAARAARGAAAAAESRRRSIPSRFAAGLRMRPWRRAGIRYNSGDGSAQEGRRDAGRGDARAAASRAAADRRRICRIRSSSRPIAARRTRSSPRPRTVRCRPPGADSILPLAYYAPDEGYRVPAMLAPFEGEEAIEMPTSTGKRRDMRRAGQLKFSVKGQTLTLDGVRRSDRSSEVAPVRAVLRSDERNRNVSRPGGISISRAPRPGSTISISIAPTIRIAISTTNMIVRSLRQRTGWACRSGRESA